LQCIWRVLYIHEYPSSKTGWKLCQCIGVRSLPLLRSRHTPLRISIGLGSWKLCIVLPPTLKELVYEPFPPGDIHMLKVHDNFALCFTVDKVHSAQVGDTPKMEGWTQLWPHLRPLILRVNGIVLGPFVNAPGIQRLYPTLVAFNALDSGTWSVDEDGCVLRLRPAGVPLCGPTRTHARRDGDEDVDSRDFSASKTGGLVLCRSPPPDLFCVWP
jgi:hypothetical protein